MLEHLEQGCAYSGADSRLLERRVSSLRHLDQEASFSRGLRLQGLLLAGVASVGFDVLELLPYSSGAGGPGPPWRAGRLGRLRGVKTLSQIRITGQLC